MSGQRIMGAEIDGTEFHLGDALSTVRDVVDDTGKVINSFEFDEYGNLLSSSGSGATSPKTWIGGLSVNDDRADSGVFNMGHRNYAAGVLGRFISRDPIGFSGGLNMYAYPTNPVSFVDPMGLECIYALYGPDNPLGGGFEAPGDWVARMRGKGHEVFVKPLTLANLEQAVMLGDVVLFEGHGMQLGEDRIFSGIKGHDGLISVKDLQRILEANPPNGDNQLLVVGGCASHRGPVIKNALEESLGPNRAYVGVTDSAAPTGRFREFVEKMADNPGASVNDTVKWFNENGLQPRSPLGGGNPQYDYTGNGHINWTKFR